MAKELFTTSLFNDASLVSYWRFEGNSTDSKGSNNGTDTSITYNTGNGKFNQGAGFNGSSSIISLPGITFSGNFTVHGWIKTSTDSTQIWQGYADASSKVAGVYLSIGFFTANKVAILSGKNTGSIAGTDYQKAISTTSVTDGNWHMVDGVYDGSNLYIYVDGNLENTVAWANNPAYQTPTYTLFGGLDSTGTISSFYNGAMDDFAVFSRALTASEIANLFVSGGMIGKFYEG